MSAKRLLDAVQSFIDFISSIFIGLAVILLFYAVVMRYVFQNPPAWSQEVTRYLFIWLIMLGAASVTRDQNHLRIAVFADMLPSRFKPFLSLFLNFLMLIFCGVLIQQSLKIYPKVAEAMSPILPISLGWLYLAIPVGGALMILFLLENCLGLITKKPNLSLSEE